MHYSVLEKRVQSYCLSRRVTHYRLKCRIHLPNLTVDAAVATLLMYRYRMIVYNGHETHNRLIIWYFPGLIWSTASSFLEVLHG